MPANLIPWEISNVPSELQLELSRRKTNISFNYQKIDGWSKDGGDWQRYKGPMTSWVRVCSNGSGRSDVNKPRFVFYGGKNFYQTYGFKCGGSDENQQIIGYTPDGKPHTIENKITNQYPIHVPTPEIVSIETIIQKELFRRATIRWKCFSSKQLEYMTPYFLTPGITIVVEFGWNHFNPNSLIDLTNLNKLKEYYFKNPNPIYTKNILDSNGNYDCVFGMVTNFEWSINGNQIDCTTEVTSKDRLYAGIPISTIVAEKDNPTSEKSNIKYFSNIRKICETDFIKNLKAIATSDTLSDAPKKITNLQLYQLIKNGNIPGNKEMKEEYWRGIFYGRDDDKQFKKSEQLDYKWTRAKKGDFDDGGSDEMWVNMGFICELLNRCLPLPDPVNGSFFSVNVDVSVIGAHPNLISCDSKLLLIPNGIAPKYMWGEIGKTLNGDTGDYKNQFKSPKKEINKSKEDVNDPLWKADLQLMKIFKQEDGSYRDDIDYIINSNRYFFLSNRDYCFPFYSEQTIEIGNGGDAIYDANFYGFFKDLYFNVKRFIELVKDENIKTYVDLYKAIFDDINKAGGNFWEFVLVPNEHGEGMMVIDKKMLPSGNNRSKVWCFDYLDSNQLMLSLGFKPKMTDAQSCRVLFAESNNPNSKTVTKEENDLLNYKFDDEILKEIQIKEPTVLPSSNESEDPFLGQIKMLQHIEPKDGKDSCQFTIMINNKPYFRRLCMPEPEMLMCLLDDHDIEKNQRYTGPQPITVEITLQGIGGLRTFMAFLIRNLPDPYNHKDVCYIIQDIQHSIQNGNWETTIKAGIRPLRNYIKYKMGIEN